MSVDLANAIHQLVTNQTQLSQAITNLATHTGKSISKPAAYNGMRGDDARRFMAAFELYANTIPSLSTDYQKRITAAISLLEGDAAIWATPYTEAINKSTVAGGTGQYPFASWTAFKSAFTERFETTDATTDAKDALKALWQNNNSVAWYAATFKQYADRTGYSEKKNPAEER